jgi:hypothetical protein
MMTTSSASLCSSASRAGGSVSGTATRKDRQVHLAVGATSPTWCRGEQRLGGLSAHQQGAAGRWPLHGAVSFATSRRAVAASRRCLRRPLPPSPAFRLVVARRISTASHPAISEKQFWER